MISCATHSRTHLERSVDVRLGPSPSDYASANGPVLSASDEPGLEMEFWGQGFGLTQPPGCSIKGSHDPYRSPTTQTAWGGHHYLSVYKMGNFPFYPFWTADHFVDGGQVDCEIDEADLLKAGGA